MKNMMGDCVKICPIAKLRQVSWIIQCHVIGTNKKEKCYLEYTFPET